MPDNLYYHINKASLAMEPVALLDSFVQIRTYGQKLWRKVVALEAIPPFQCLDMGAILTGANSAKLNAGNLDLDDDEFGQWRYFPLDNVQLTCYNPAGVSKAQLKNIQVAIDRSILYRDPSLITTEICTWEDQRPAFQALNFSGANLAACRIIAFGYRFLTNTVEANELNRLSNGSQQYTIIPCSAPGPGIGRR